MAKRSRAAGVVSKLGVILAAFLVVGPALAWLRLVPALAGFGIFAVGGLGALVVAVVSIVQAARGRGLRRGGAAAIVAAVVFMVLASLDAGAPTINDFTTDLADPPAFTHAATLPGNAGRDLGYPREFADVQRKCCADLRPARIAVARGLAFGRARELARKNGWTITSEDYKAGTIEAVATSRIFGFQDDIAIRVREHDPGISDVDVRSKSRDGRGDLGVNANRIRAFVESLEWGPLGKPEGASPSPTLP